MPTFIDGQQNLASLQVPDLYIDIIPPSPFLSGAPTNKVGVVGVASWGPVNSIVNISQPADCAYKLGTPMIRNHDLAWYIWCATSMGGSGAYACIRVSDGSDLAASAPMQNTAASGSITLTAQPTANQTVTVGNVAFTYVASGATGNQVNIGLNVAASAGALAAALSASATSPVNTLTYSVVGNTVTATAKTPGSGANSVTLSTTVTGATVSGATLAGGGAPITITAKYSGTIGNKIRMTLATGTAPNTVLAAVSFPGRPAEIFNNIPGTGAAFWTNLANAINNGSFYRGPSDYVVATAGTIAVAPTLATPVTLTGGTDGDTGVTDQTLVGMDVIPRTGMYALRSSGIDAFALCDLATTSLWPAMDIFALGEDCLACYADTNGASYATTASDRVSVGLDSFSSWIAVGDYPSFYDSQNQVVRLVNPAAVQVGFCGNASPEQSPLNKRISGVVSTESSMEGTTYSDADLEAINTSGIEVLIGPPTTLGGDYYTFATGRNASSNTAGNGVEYTRVTNFIARSLNSFAAKSIVGMLQSSRPDDPTRTRAKQLVDGFLAQLANPESGASGQGIIDSFMTVCDLTNNSLDSQARGYLFLNMNVRYLNTVRYFIIKLAGGGNVVIQNSADPISSAALAA